MFGMGLFEILLISVIAIIALGPEKLPKAMVEIARFLKKFKSGIDEAKSTLDTELKLSDMKEEANKFRAQIENVKSTVKLDNINLDVNSILDDTPKSKNTNFKLGDDENIGQENNKKTTEKQETNEIKKEDAVNV